MKISEGKKGVYYRVPENGKTAKICTLTHQPQAIFSHKPQPSVFFSTINFLFRIATAFQVNEAGLNLQFVMTVVLQLCEGLTDNNCYLVEAST